jgi:glutamate 5-kinase
MKVEGDFVAGETVEMVTPDARIIARGIVGFDADEIPQLLGRSTKDLGKELGPEYERELVHRDEMVFL